MNDWLRMRWWDWLIVLMFVTTLVLIAWPDLVAWVDGGEVVGYR